MGWLDDLGLGDWSPVVQQVLPEVVKLGSTYVQGQIQHKANREAKKAAKRAGMFASRLDPRVFGRGPRVEAPIPRGTQLPGGGTWPGKRRRMNALNPRALRRAQSRMTSFEKFVLRNFRLLHKSKLRRKKRRR